MHVIHRKRIFNAQYSLSKIISFSRTMKTERTAILFTNRNVELSDVNNFESPSTSLEYSIG